MSKKICLKAEYPVRVDHGLNAKEILQKTQSFYSTFPNYKIIQVAPGLYKRGVSVYELCVPLTLRNIWKELATLNAKPATFEALYGLSLLALCDVHHIGPVYALATYFDSPPRGRAYGYLLKYKGVSDAIPELHIGGLPDIFPSGTFVIASHILDIRPLTREEMRDIPPL
jgi:hypothetical protein